MPRALARRPRAGRLLGSALVLALSVPGTALAAPPEQNAYREHVQLAGAVWLTETEHSLTDLTLRVHDVDLKSGPGRPVSGPGVTLFYLHREIDPADGTRTDTNYEGFAALDRSSLDFSPALRAASARFDVTLYGYRCVYPPGWGVAAAPAAVVECTEIGEPTVTVEVAWSGQGEIHRDVWTSKAADPPAYRFFSRTVEAVRDATAVGRVAGDGLVLAEGAVTYGVLLRGKFQQHELWRP